MSWRYRLVLTVADDSAMGNIVVFGRTLDPLFGKTATDFHRFVHFLRIHVFPNFVELSNELLSSQVEWTGTVGSTTDFSRRSPRFDPRQGHCLLWP